jgi:ATP-dependent DNA ligase
MLSSKLYLTPAWQTLQQGTMSNYVVNTTERATPELATLVSRSPQGDQWLHEIKFDGYRMAGVAGG